MSANIEASLSLKIAQYQASLAKARGDITKLKEHAKREGAGLGQNLFKGIVAFAAGGTILSLGKTALDTVVKMDRMTRAMTTMEGSASGAEKRLADLREVAKLPGIDFEQAVQGDIRLRSVGLSAETSRQALIEFGNALALSGGSASDLDGVILALGQISSKGKVSAEEINQIAERVPQIRAVMKDVFGTADTEALQDMGISADDFITRTIAGFGQLDRATAGLDESLSDIAQSINTMINEGAAPIVNELVPAFAELTSALAENKDAFVTLGTFGVQSLKGIAEALGVLNQVGSGVGEGIGKMMGFGGVSTNSASAVNRQASDEAMAAEAFAKNGPAKRYDSVLMGPPAPAAPAASAAAASGVVDPKAAAKALKDAEEARTKLMREQQQLAQAQMQDYLSILPPNLKLIEVQREILRIKDDIENLPMHELEKLKLQQELVKWAAEERDAKRGIADESKRAADEQKAAEEEAAGQAGSLATFEAEMALIDAKLSKDKELTAELERQAAIQEIQNQLMEDAGLSADDALSKATQRIDKEDELKKQLEGAKDGGRYDAEGRRADGRRQIKGYSAEEQGGAGDARARAEKRLQDARDRVGSRTAGSFGSLDEQTRKNAANGSGLANQAQQNAQKEGANPQQQTGQMVITLITQILEAVK